MNRRNKMIIAVVIVLALLVLGSLFLRFQLPPVPIAAEPLPGLTVVGVPITNSLLTMLVVDVILVVLAVLATRRMQLIPSGLQNLVEWVVEKLYGLTESMAGKKWAPRFFVIVATIFFYVLVSNWFGLLPGLAAFGFCEAHLEPSHGGETVEVHTRIPSASEPGVARLAAPLPAAETPNPPLGCRPGEVLVPIFRSPSTDLNNNLALALISVVMSQVFGVMALGPGYFGKFFNIKGMLQAFRPAPTGERRGCGGALAVFAFGAIQFFVGILEAISEFAKIISFSFRLFGNIFAGEVMLLVLASLVPLVLTLPFLGLEVFVGLIQAFVFFILTLAFFTLATASHTQEHK